MILTSGFGYINDRRSRGRQNERKREQGKDDGDPPFFHTVPPSSMFFTLSSWGEMHAYEDFTKSVTLCITRE